MCSSDLSGIGDADGDGLDDFAIGANTALADGAVYVFFGTPAASGRIGDAADSTVIGLRSANFGASIGGGFDCDGDGYDDMLVTESAGRTRYVHLFTEVEDASSPTNARTSWYAANGGGLGDVLAAGDFAGNGAVDIVVPEPDLGRIHILDDCSSGTHDVDDDRATLVGEAGSEVGAALAIVGDLDGDGLEDLFAGAPAADSETGAVWGVLGR